MDEKVLAAMARWPDVPDVYGWLSLSERGEWRLHPQGDALLPEHCTDGGYSPGESISSPPILQFINRNYEADDRGQWYFQNGPQRVFVRLDAAPHILRTVTAKAGGTGLRSHTGQDITAVQAWWLDDGGKLYAETDRGPGLIAGRDLADLLARLHLDGGGTLLDALEHAPAKGPLRVTGSPALSASLRFCAEADVAGILGFVRCPALGRITP
ncbi:DUF2946 family protein [Pusillimonas sp. SM2304]|uniref:DUF2946 family protein n=1 Tax=Pusillimonas sp. SM2304 TaxID=3073241 RepID=UPI002874526E|nr:DUF2946 family protein [Pusillimonas sp. SM2304]MDS1140744.1 DUF2946 family protein [Pusillimonas sp. SM2304]